jgi:hypothetical protein
MWCRVAWDGVGQRDEAGVVTEGKRKSSWAMSGGKEVKGGGVEVREGEGEVDERVGEGEVAEWTGKEKLEMYEGKITRPLLQSIVREFFERKAMPKTGWSTFACKKFCVKEWEPNCIFFCTKCQEGIFSPLALTILGPEG